LGHGSNRCVRCGVERERGQCNESGGRRIHNVGERRMERAGPQGNGNRGGEKRNENDFSLVPCHYVENKYSMYRTLAVCIA
jgi:hypothetical protein